MTVRLRPGLCSVTFRELDTATVITLAQQAGLDGIEWGGDVHLPPGDTAHAETVARQCANAGLACPSYGSYFFAGFSAAEELTPTIDTALALGASTLRIWTPFGTESDAPANERARIADAVADTVRVAAEHGLRTALEFHPGTLTHTAASAAQLLRAVSHEHLFTYWQPEAGAAADHSLAEFHAVQADLAHLHVFSWDPDSEHRRPLNHLEPLWTAVLRDARAAGGWEGDRFAYLEFVADDDPDQFRTDAATLRRWLAATDS